MPSSHNRAPRPKSMTASTEFSTCQSTSWDSVSSSRTRRQWTCKRRNGSPPGEGGDLGENVGCKFAFPNNRKFSAYEASTELTVGGTFVLFIGLGSCKGKRFDTLWGPGK